MDLELIKKLCILNENQLHSLLYDYLKKHYKRVFSRPEYMFAEGDIPICLVAHLDTVFSHTPNLEDFFYDQEKKMLWAPGGSGFDDRAGIYAILQILVSGARPHLIITHGEEKGGIGSHALVEAFPKCPFKHCKALIQIDRAYENDCVFYECENNEFEKYIESFGFETSWGTFSDISILGPAWKIAAVNVSCGYLDEHSTCERLMCDWLDKTIERVKDILDQAGSMKKYKYIARKHRPFTSWSGIAPSSCLICGKPTPGSIGHWIYDEDFPYKVCDSCFQQYYETDETVGTGFDF